MAMRIPEAQKPTLKMLTELPDETFERLCTAIQNATPQMTSSGLSRQITKTLNPRVPGARDILGLLMSLETARLQRRQNVPEIVNDLVEAVRSSDIFANDPNSTEAIERLQTRISVLFSVGKAVELTTRIADVYLSHEKLFRQARVFTDIRPIFGLDSVDAPRVGAIVHNLAITTSNSNGGNVETPYIAMNVHDLRELKQVVERALSKDEVLRKTIASTGMTYVEDERLEHQQ